MSNTKNWRPCKDGSVFSFVKTNIDNFRFITKNKFNLEQNHQSVEVRRNAIIPTRKGSTSRQRCTSCGLGSLSWGCSINVKSKDDSRDNFSFIYAIWGMYEVVICNIMNSRKGKSNSIKIKLTMNVWKTCYIEICGCNL